MKNYALFPALRHCNAFSIQAASNTRKIGKLSIRHFMNQLRNSKHILNYAWSGWGISILQPFSMDICAALVVKTTDNPFKALSGDITFFLMSPMN